MNVCGTNLELREDRVPHFRRGLFCAVVTNVRRLYLDESGMPFQEFPYIVVCHHRIAVTSVRQRNRADEALHVRVCM